MMIKDYKQTFNKVTTYPYRANAFKVCESEFQETVLKRRKC